MLPTWLASMKPLSLSSEDGGIGRPPCLSSIYVGLGDSGLFSWAVSALSAEPSLQLHIS